MHLPNATYRLQFRNGMDFARAAELIPYLARLGISHLYASPVFTAVRGSTHGYDIVNFNEIDPALGGEAGFRELVRALKGHGLGIVLDIVPNHMAAHIENDWWHNVIEWGRASHRAACFDIDWQQPLTLPFLGQSFEAELAAGALRLAFDRNRHCLAFDYCGTPYPLHPGTYVEALDEGNPAFDGIAAIARAAEPAESARFHAELAAVATIPPIAAALDRHLARVSAAKLTRLHELQAWRLTDWRTARDHLSYRRFFEITGLVGVRVEDPAVFADTHRLALELIGQGLVDGLRVDHIDGLADPELYLHWLRQEVGSGAYVIVEKILEAAEPLPGQWPVEGTTGYEFISALAELLTDESPPSDRWDEKRRARVEEEVRECKLMLLRHNFNAEVTRLARLLGDGGRAGGERVAEAIRQLIAALSVYRTYVSDRGVHARDQQIIDGIRAKASAAAPAVATEIALVAAALTAKRGLAEEEGSSEFRRRFQQLSGAVMAKAVEDTFFYRRGDFLAANEVGADPSWRPGGVERFHSMMRTRSSDATRGLSATSTHDTKRGEDARARLYVISEASEIWRGAVARWHDMNKACIRPLPTGDAPEADVEQFLYQSLLGIWPVGKLREEGVLSSLCERMKAFAVKAVREAKLRTNWDSPDGPYEAAVSGFLHDLLEWRNRAFIEDFDRTARPFIVAGLINSLSQTLVKLTAPGIPDIYQGSERLDLSLVDPDNRRGFSPVLTLGKPPRRPTVSEFEDLKQWMIGECLVYRGREGRNLFGTGEYRALIVEGPAARHAAAFMRCSPGDLLLTVVPRLVFGQTEGSRLSVRPALWQETALVWPVGCQRMRLRNRFTGAVLEPRDVLPLAEIFDGFPVACFVRA